ncbi:NUAK family SNF1-like kinase 1 isoform X2 [Ornithodoros turicata]|uniref:NUAK family SNF1-like kinase 1 isoform X2 n=1 Tax=Ornithodoros turicata TaxID=34597 RepID=UPI00313911B2
MVLQEERVDGGRPPEKKHKLKQRFQVIRKLGQGTYGKVQLAINKDTDQEVAIKTIKKSKIETEQDSLRIRREIQIMSSIQHPYIIHIYEVFENKDKIVLVMQYASGGELYDYVSERKELSSDEARRIFRQVASAVYYCHKNKICHRDLKLENILLDEKGNAKIADFGLSNVYDERNFLSTFCGSPLYASPEIVRGTPYYGPEVDCWSLGVLLYTLVYGAMPFDGSNFKRLVRQISEGDYFEPKNKSDASVLISRLLTVDPAKRATIVDICRDPWVNHGFDHSLLQLAEDMASLTPVRLDLLLALAPVSPTSEVPTDTDSSAEFIPAGLAAELEEQAPKRAMLESSGSLTRMSSITRKRVRPSESTLAKQAASKASTEAAVADAPLSDATAENAPKQRAEGGAEEANAPQETVGNKASEEAAQEPTSPASSTPCQDDASPEQALDSLEVDRRERTLTPEVPEVQHVEQSQREDRVEKPMISHVSSLHKVGANKGILKKPSEEEAPLERQVTGAEAKPPAKEEEEEEEEPVQNVQSTAQITLRQNSVASSKEEDEEIEGPASSRRRPSPEGSPAEERVKSPAEEGVTSPVRTYKKFTFGRDGSCITESGHIYAKPKSDGSWATVEKKTRVTRRPSNASEEEAQEVKRTESGSSSENNDIFEDMFANWRSGGGPFGHLMRMKSSMKKFNGSPSRSSDRPPREQRLREWSRGSASTERDSSDEDDFDLHFDNSHPQALFQFVKNMSRDFRNHWKGFMPMSSPFNRDAQSPTLVRWNVIDRPPRPMHSAQTSDDDMWSRADNRASLFGTIRHKPRPHDGIPFRQQRGASLERATPPEAQPVRHRVEKRLQLNVDPSNESPAMNRSQAKYNRSKSDKFDLSENGAPHRSEMNVNDFGGGAQSYNRSTSVPAREGATGGRPMLRMQVSISGSRNPNTQILISTPPPVEERSDGTLLEALQNRGLRSILSQRSRVVPPHSETETPEQSGVNEIVMNIKIT